MISIKQRIESFEKWWKLAPPKTKRTVILSIVSLILGIMLVLSSILSPPRKKHVKKKGYEVEILSATSEGKISESASVRRLRGKVNALDSDVSNIKKELHGIKDSLNNFKELLQKNQEQIQVFQGKLIEKAGELQEIIKKQQQKNKIKRLKERNKIKNNIQKETRGFNDIWAKSPQVSYPLPVKVNNPKVWKNVSSSSFSQQKKKVALVGEIREVTSKKTKNIKEIKIRIPAGSFFRGILLNGLDAPVSMSARKNPYPVLIKVKTEAWLPNEYRYDIKGCYIVAAAWGDMSSERAYFRTERFSCVKKDNGVIEVRLDGSVTDGQDGKLGVFGHLVSKEGQLIARTILASIIQGFGNALSPKESVPVFNIGEGESSKLYTNPPIGQGLRYGFFSGSGEAMKKIADYYLKMANQVFPVVEVQAGTPVEIFLLRGLTLTLRQKV